MAPSLRKPGAFSRIGLLRRYYHENQRHLVARTVVRDYRKTAGSRMEFFFRPGWVCITCKKDWG